MLSSLNVISVISNDEYKRIEGVYTLTPRIEPAAADGPVIFGPGTHKVVEECAPLMAHSGTGEGRWRMTRMSMRMVGILRQLVTLLTPGVPEISALLRSLLMHINPLNEGRLD